MMFHYVKRELETLFVHRFSNDTMPFTRIFINSSHYWILCGALIGYFLFSPNYHAPGYPSYICYGLLGFFFFAEIMNFCCHLVLRSLRPAGSKGRGIPGVNLPSYNTYIRDLDSIRFHVLITSGK